MSLLYKLTNENNCTRNNTQWGENVTHETNGRGELCGPGWLHAYTSPLLAVLLNPTHADFVYPHLWEADGVVEREDRGLKVGTTCLTTLRRIALPEITTTQKIAFGILCALQVYKVKNFVSWAKNWLNGKDRSHGAAAYAAYAAYATNATYAATNAANAAAYTTYDTNAAAYAAANAAAYAANTANTAATYAAANAAALNLTEIAEKSLSY